MGVLATSIQTSFFVLVVAASLCQVRFQVGWTSGLLNTALLNENIYRGNISKGPTVHRQSEAALLL